MKTISSTLFVVLVLFLGSCSQAPSENVIQTAIAETQSAIPASIDTMTPTGIPVVTESPILTTPTNPSMTKNVPSSIDPRLFVLTTKDLPQDYQLVLSQSGYRSNQLTASTRNNPAEFLSKLDSWGRVNGYSALYLRGNSWLRSDAIIMDNEDGARDYFTNSKNEILQNGGMELSAPKVGDEAFTFTNMDITGQQTGIAIRIRNVLAFIVSYGQSNIKFEELTRLAEKMASLIVDNPSEIGLALLPDKTPMPIPSNPLLEFPTMTPEPTSVVIINSLEQTQTLGPIWDSTRDESYSVTVVLHNVKFSSGSGWDTPKSGNIYANVDLTITNLGPGTLRSISPYDFQVRDANGALRDSDYISEFSDCELEMVDLSPGGSISGCVSFEVPDTGTLELIYAPYKYEGLEPGRYLSFIIR